MGSRWRERGGEYRWLSAVRTAWAERSSPGGFRSACPGHLGRVGQDLGAAATMRVGPSVAGGARLELRDWDRGGRRPTVSEP
ncbi:hypothetical protein GCM10008995_14920 [Halobellus salinus]|uniref:Uncharacterized protein n=1 Tax=Halobellus salinus TaxID=931585 RepID=A0A830EF70_9EURY|nr:hypothetical protein GCM10008995_14920 [Halobellus salinus]SMP23991.1 hypothetical protein SAMN06265347_109138 [Halobellus salinus]